MSKQYLSVKEAFSTKRTATSEGSQAILPAEYLEKLLGDSDIDFDPKLQSKVFESEPGHSVLEHAWWA